MTYHYYEFFVCSEIRGEILETVNISLALGLCIIVSMFSQQASGPSNHVSRQFKSQIGIGINLRYCYSTVLEYSQ